MIGNIHIYRVINHKEVDTIFIKVLIGTKIWHMMHRRNYNFRVINWEGEDGA